MRGKKEINIVILDDVKENLYELASLVDELGYVAKPVVTISQAMNVLRMGDVDLLLLDIAMPEMSGFEFLRRMRWNHQWDDIPVVFVSAYQDMSTKTEAFELGANDYIIRPYEEKECGYRIRKAVAVSQEMKKLKDQKDAMAQMLLYKRSETEEAKRQVVEAILTMISEQEASPGHFQRIRMSAVHFAKGLSVVPEFEKSISEKFVETLEVAAPLYVLSGMPGRRQELEGLKGKEKDNEYLKMGVEIANFYGAKYQETAMEIPLSAQIVSLAVRYDMLPYGARECMEIIDQEAGSLYNPLLVRAFEVIQMPYFLDNKKEEGVS